MLISLSSGNSFYLSPFEITVPPLKSSVLTSSNEMSSWTRLALAVSSSEMVILSEIWGNIERQERHCARHKLWVLPLTGQAGWIKNEKNKEKTFFLPHPLIPHPSVGVFILLSNVCSLSFSSSPCFCLKFHAVLNLKKTDCVCQVSHWAFTFITQAEYNKEDRLHSARFWNNVARAWQLNSAWLSPDSHSALIWWELTKLWLENKVKDGNRCLESQSYHRSFKDVVYRTICSLQLHGKKV